MEKIVEVKNLKKAFNGFMAVDDVSFEIGRGEILGLLGPNGAGKTTIIHMLLGLTTPTSGEIRMFGMELGGNRREILSDINFSSSYVSMPLSLTVKENLRVFAILYNVRDREDKIDELLRAFEIHDIRDKLVRKLSSGQVTRLCLVKALLNDPKLLFLDEPTASLDPDIADKTRKLLKRFRDERGLTILYTSHNMKEMEEMSDRIVFLDKGKVMASGRPLDVLRVFEKKSLEEVFIKVARGEG
jgi:ABC-2 type transport system ATP-binding protein